MCGRYALTLPPEAVRMLFGYEEQPNFPPRYNIAPTQPIAIMRAMRDADGHLHRRFALVRWGLIPGWVKDVKAFPLIINARADGLDAKPAFRGALRHRRCIVMADGFYEWPRARAARARGASPCLFSRRDGETMAFAGLWEDYLGADGSEIETACIVTTDANRLIAGLHDRMPAILDRNDIACWIDTRDTPPREALAMLRPAPDDLLQCVPVGNAVNKVANDGPDVQAPAGPVIVAEGPPRPAQGELF